MSEICPICRIVAGDVKSWVVYENQHIICFFPRMFDCFGHTIIASKEHYPDLFTVPEAVLVEATKAAQQLALHYQKVIGAKGLFLRHSSGATKPEYVYQRPTYHFHLHLLPQFEDEVLNNLTAFDTIEEPDREELIQLLRLEEKNPSCEVSSYV